MRREPAARGEVEVDGATLLRGERSRARATSNDRLEEPWEDSAFARIAARLAPSSDTNSNRAHHDYLGVVGSSVRAARGPHDALLAARVIPGVARDCRRFSPPSPSCPPLEDAARRTGRARPAAIGRYGRWRDPDSNRGTTILSQALETVEMADVLSLWIRRRLVGMAGASGPNLDSRLSRLHRVPCLSLPWTPNGAVGRVGRDARSSGKAGMSSARAPTAACRRRRDGCLDEGELDAARLAAHAAHELLGKLLALVERVQNLEAEPGGDRRARGRALDGCSRALTRRRKALIAPCRVYALVNYRRRSLGRAAVAPQPIVPATRISPASMSMRPTEP